MSQAGEIVDAAEEGGREDPFDDPLDSAEVDRDASHAGPEPGERLELAFIGRSNVGKSSLINALCRAEDLCAASRQPGRTTSINFYGVGGGDYPPFALVDMPGYGFARRSKEARKQWQALIARFLARRHRDTLARVVLAVDLTRGIDEEDSQVIQLLEHLAVPWMLVLTKSDMLTEPRARASAIANAVAQCSRLSAVFPALYVVSAQERWGLEEVLDGLATAVDIDMLPVRSTQEAVRWWNARKRRALERRSDASALPALEVPRESAHAREVRVLADLASSREAPWEQHGYANAGEETKTERRVPARGRGRR